MTPSPVDKIPQKILLVDDLSENLDLLQKVITPLGIEMVCVSSGEDALVAVQHHQFSLIILDVIMPGMDGYTLGRKLKANPDTQEIPLIFITASDRVADELVEGYEIGAVDFIQKPYIPQVLKSKVKALLDIDSKLRSLKQQQADLVERESEHVAELEIRQNALNQSEQTMLLMMEEALEAKVQAEETAERYLTLFQNLPSGFALHEMIYDDDGKAVDYRFLEINPSFEHLTGLNAEDLIGKTVKEVLPQTEQYWIDFYDMVVKTGKHAFYEEHSKELNKYFNVRAYRPESGKFAVLFSDVTERKRTAERLRLTQFTVDKLKLAVYWVNGEGRFTYVNQEACRELGYTQDELLQLSIWDLDADLTAENWPAVLQEICTYGNVTSELRHQRKDGSLFPVEVKANYLEFDGNVIVCGFAQNITERRATQEELISSQRLLRTIIDAIPTRVFWKDKDLIFTGCNLAFARDMGFGHWDEIVGKTNFDFPLSPEHIDMYHAVDQSVLQSGIPKLAFVEELQLKNKPKQWLKINKIPLSDPKGEIMGVLGTYEDITESKRLQEGIEKQILSLTRPLEDTEDISFEVLFNLEDIQRLQDEFSVATNVASIITYPNGTPITKPSNFTDLCKCVIRGTAIGCANCIVSDSELGRVHPSGPIMQSCLSGGLWDAGASIVVGGKHIASWLIGQVRDETQNEEDMLAYAREIGADEEIFLEAFRRVPSMSRERFQQISNVLFSFANQLSTTAYQNIQQARFIADEKRRTQELLRLSTAIEQSPEVIVITNCDGVIEYVNPAFERSSGYTCDEVIGRTPAVLRSYQHSEKFYGELWQTIKAGNVWNGRFVNQRKDGSHYTEEAVISPVKSAEGTIINFVAVKRDITNELIQEEKMQQAQKMEAVGQLAGGVAHDFNNILQSIMGFSDLLTLTLDKSDVNSLENVEGIQKAAMHAADLTRQLLAYSRKQHVRFSTVNLNEVIKKTLNFLNSVIGENIRVVTDLDPELYLINADDGQLERALLNLALNARDAMPQGGVLTLRTENTSFSVLDSSCPPYAQVGDYVTLTLTDTGTGISPDVLGHIFEPFFSTKPVGSGSGLGLSASYGIIRKHDGWIDVSSVPDEGAVFKIFLPVRQNGSHLAEDVDAAPKHLTPKGKGQKILIVEDSEPVRLVSETILKEAGYAVTITTNAEEAERVFDQEKGNFDLLFTDIILPNKTGADLALDLRGKKPDLQILFCSGYSGDRINQVGDSLKDITLLEKPFNRSTLLHHISELLKDA